MQATPRILLITDPSMCYHLGALKIAWVTSSPNDIIEGKSKDLQCYFLGQPLPDEVHWYKDGELVTNETEGIYHSEDEREKNGEKTLRSTLHLPKGREEMKGFYKCSVKNSIPSSASFEIQMIYECNKLFIPCKGNCVSCYYSLTGFIIISSFPCWKKMA